MMKKWIAMALTLCLLVGTLAGCGASSIISYDGEGLNETTLRYQIYNTKLGLETQNSIADEARAAEYWAEDNTADQMEGKTPFEYATESLLKELKEELLIVSMAKERNLSATDEQIAEMRNMLIAQTFGSEEAYKTTADIFGFTDENMDWIAKLNVSYMNIVNELYPREKLAAYADENGWVRVKHVLIQKSDTVTMDDAKKKAQDVCDRAANGEDFDKLVADLSEDPGSTTYPDGYLVATGSGMVESFEKASLALAEGEVSEPIATDYGYHVIKRYPIGAVTDMDLSMGSALTNHYQEETTKLFQVELDAAMAEKGDSVEVDIEAFKELFKTLTVPQSYYDAIAMMQQSMQEELEAQLTPAE